MAFLENFTRGAYPESLETSSNWTKVGGTILADCTTGGQLTTASTIGTEALWQCPDQGNVDHYSQIDKVNTVDNFGFMCVVRATDASNYIGARYNSGQVQLYKVVAGAFTGLGTPYTYTWVANDTVKLEVSGNDFIVSINGTSRITATDSFNNTETRQGIVVRSSTTAATYDNFEAGAISTGATITASDATARRGQTDYKFTLSGGDATAGTATISDGVNTSSITITTYNANGINTCTIPSTIAVLYDATAVLTFTDAVSGTPTAAVSFQPAALNSYIDLVSPLNTDDGYADWHYSGTAATGWQYEWVTLTSPSSKTITLNADSGMILSSASTVNENADFWAINLTGVRSASFNVLFQFVSSGAGSSRLGIGLSLGL